ncbi:MAG: sodium ion-translocating decarboxylase subunit beta, partial [Planctomycetota bacterium]|nr:sodium ion-translocating decarboxylase subunit beta [Planctomycetota bacterium]
WVKEDGSPGLLQMFYNVGIITDVFPCLIFIGIGAMIDFTPLLANPLMLLFGAAGQFGIFLTVIFALQAGFTRLESCAIGVIGACDGPTAIYVTAHYAKHLLAPVSVAAYSYMSMVPILQPPIMRLLTTKRERETIMPTAGYKVSRTTKLLFPIIVTLIASLVAPLCAPLIGLLMLGNFLRESGVVERLSQSAQNEITNIVTLFLGITIGSTMQGKEFLKPDTLLVFAFGLVAISLDTVAGVLLGKLMYLLSRGKINPLIGAAGISAFPMSSRVVQIEGQKANKKSILLMYAVGANAGGQIGSVIAAGVMLSVLRSIGAA